MYAASLQEQGLGRIWESLPLGLRLRFPVNPAREQRRLFVRRAHSAFCFLQGPCCSVLASAQTWSGFLEFSFTLDSGSLNFWDISQGSVLDT